MSIQIDPAEGIRSQAALEPEIRGLLVNGPKMGAPAKTAKIRGTAPGQTGHGGTQRTQWAVLCRIFGALKPACSSLSDQKRRFGLFLPCHRAPLSETTSTGLGTCPAAGTLAGGSVGVGWHAGARGDTGFIPDSSAPCVHAPLCPKRPGACLCGRAPPSLCGRGREPDPPLCQMLGDPLSPKRPKGCTLAG